MRFTQYPFPGFRLPSGKARLGPALSAGQFATTPTRLTEHTSFGSNPGQLRMFAYVPARLPEGAPLVVILHGCTQTASAYDHGAGWCDLADEAGFAVLAPEQQPSNNPLNCFNWFQPGDVSRGEGEAASIHQMVTRLVADHRLDAKRIFITGLSAGGAMSAAMLSLYPDVFAGGAIIAGLPYGTAQNVPEALNHMNRAPERSGEAWADAVRGALASPHKGGWPVVSIWHGDADDKVDISNSAALVAQWRTLHDLPGVPETDQQNGFVKQVWRDASGRAVVESTTVKGMGHGTPVGGTENYGSAGPHFFDMGISSSVRIAEFWGLVKGPVRARKARAAEPAFAGMKTGNVKTVIVGALKKAGLM